MGLIWSTCNALPCLRSSSILSGGLCRVWRVRGLVPFVKQRKLKLKAKLQSSSFHFSFKRFIPGAFSAGLIGSTCTALPLGSVGGSP